MKNQKSADLLPLPALLIERIASGQWQHPGDAALRAMIPLLEYSLDFLCDVTRIYKESSVSISDRDSEILGILPDIHPQSTDLPFLNRDLMLFIAVNRVAGDDVAIALDYRTSMIDPRVVASYWIENKYGRWCAVAPTLSHFVDMLDVVRYGQLIGGSR